MSNFGNNSFKLIMSPGYEHPNNSDSKDLHQIILSQNVFNFSSIQDAYIFFRQKFSEKLPQVDSEEEIHKYILDIMKKDDEMDLNEKYICSFYLAMNKNLLSKDVIDDILEEEFHLTLMDWLKYEKKFVEDELYEAQNKSTNKNNYNFNIYIGLLINIISLYEIFHIKSKDLVEFNFYEKLFKINKFVKLNIKLNINISLSFLINKIENLLQKWKIQQDCYILSQNILKFTKTREKTFLSKKTKRPEVSKEKEETEADSEEGVGSMNSDLTQNYNSKKLGGLFIKNKKNINKNKKVNFDLQNNQTFFFNKEERVSSHFNNIEKCDNQNSSLRF